MQLKEILGLNERKIISKSQIFLRPLIYVLSNSTIFPIAPVLSYKKCAKFKIQYLWVTHVKKNPNCAYLGSELELDTYETHFNEDLMATKHQELAQAFYSSDFPPAKTFYQGKNIV